MAGRNALGVGSVEERLQRLEMLANFREYIAPVSIVGGRDVGATPPLHPLLSSAGHSDTATQTVSRGSLIYGNSTPAWDELVAAGSDGALVTDGTDPSWATSTTNGEVLRRAGGVIGFGPVDLDAGTGISVTGTLGVAQGGTNLASGTSGGILGFTASNALSSSALLTDNVLMVGGGAGATPNTLAAGLGTTTQVLHGNAAGEPTWGQVAISTDVSGLGTGVATFLGTPTSANFAAAVTGETGTGGVVFDTSPTIVTPTIASFTNATHTHQNAAGGGTLDHGLALTGLTDDDHTQYLLLAGRTGTTNNPTLSTSTDGTLTGSSASGGDLRLVANSVDGTVGGTTATEGYVQPIQPVHLLVDGYTFDNDTGGLGLTAAQSRAVAVMAVGGGTITLSGTNPTYRILTCDGTVALTESNGWALGMGVLFNHGLTYTNADGLNLGPVFTFVDQPTYSVTTTAGARTMTQHIGLYSAPTLSRATGANTATLTSLYGVFSKPTVNTGTALTSYYGLYMSSPGGAATITTRYGLYMEDPVGATVTNDYWFGWNAAAGTHNAVIAHSGAGSPTLHTAGNAPVTGDPDGWLKVNDNGTAAYIPFWR